MMNKYFDTNIGYWGKTKMLEKLKNSLISSNQKRELKRKLGDIYALQRHRAVNSKMLKKQYKRISAPFPFASVQIDLAFLPNLQSPINNNVIGFIIFIDVFSRYIWIKTLTNRKQIHNKVNEVMNEMQRDFGKIPQHLTADNEFATNELQRLVATRIKGRLWLAEPHEKYRTGIVERAIRTMKDLIKRYLTQNNTTKYVDILPNLVYNYNNTRHDYTRTRPSVAIQTGQTFPRIEHNFVKKLNIGDKVRILDPRKRGWTKGDVPYYTKDLYVVVSFDRNRYRVRNPKNANDPRNKRPWAYHQLYKINNVIKGNPLTVRQNGQEPPEDSYNVKVSNAQGYDDQLSINRHRNKNKRYRQRENIDLDNIIDINERRDAYKRVGMDDVNVPSDEDDEKAEILEQAETTNQRKLRILKNRLDVYKRAGSKNPREMAKIMKDIQKLENNPSSIMVEPSSVGQRDSMLRRGARIRQKVKNDEIRPKPRSKLSKKDKPETLSDFEREEKKIDKLIEKYGMQGKFHLQHKTRQRKKKLLNAKKKFMDQKNKKFKLPKKLHSIPENEEFVPPNVSSDSDSSDTDDVSSESSNSDNDVVIEMEFEQNIARAKRNKQYKKLRHLRKRYKRWKKNKK